MSCLRQLLDATDAVAVDLVVGGRGPAGEKHIEADAFGELRGTPVEIVVERNKFSFPLRSSSDFSTHININSR